MFFVLRYFLLLAILPILFITVFSNESYSQTPFLDSEGLTESGIEWCESNYQIYTFTKDEFLEHHDYSIESILCFDLYNDNLWTYSGFDREQKLIEQSRIYYDEYVLYTETITISTNHPYYTTNDLIIITGTISNLYNATTTHLTITSPLHGIILSEYPTIQNNTFSTTVNATDSLFNNGTTYTITAQYEAETTITATTDFDYGTSLYPTHTILSITTDKPSYHTDDTIY